MASELTELSSQVGGHPDSMFVGDDKRILLKYIPPISQELGNYEFFQSNCKDYLPFLPHFFGTQKHGEKLYLKMENLVANYTFPCALDVKMGTKPFAPDASEEKKRIQSQKSLSTTGATLGLRIVGMKKYDPILGQFVSFPKSFGANLNTKDKIKDAFRTFFSTFSKTLESSSSTHLKQTVIPQYSKEEMQQRKEYEKIRKDVIQDVIAQLSSFSGFLSGELSHRFNFYSSSLFIAFDGLPNSQKGELIDEPLRIPQRPIVKMIDLQHVFEKTEGSIVEHEDDGYLFGVNNLIDILKEIVEE